VHGELARLKRRTSPLDVVAERIASKVRVLCLDELFVSDIADAMILAGLFAGLTQRGVSLVVTSNTPPGELYKNGLQRQKFLPAIKVLESHTEVFAVDGGIDHRLRQLTQAGTYLDSALPLTAQRLAALFSALADGAGTSGGGIQIGRRAIPVRRRSESVVWFDFAAICEGPRGTDDYIEIARQYQCVVISDVPVFDERADDAARRFVALVDEFYDRGVDLVISAAAPPQGLYRGERLKFEFRRATSRLIEMQSEEYLARQHRP
jgi:cell division protein ZapE